MLHLQQCMQLLNMKFLVRTKIQDYQTEDLSQILNWFLEGKCSAGDFVFSFETNTWQVLAEVSGVSDYFKQKPMEIIEKPMIYIALAGPFFRQAGPFTYTHIKEKIAAREVCAFTWIFVEGDKGWRQIKEVKVLNGLLPPLPEHIPEPELEVVKDLEPPPPISHVVELDMQKIENSLSNPELKVEDTRAIAAHIPELAMAEGLAIEETKAVAMPKRPPREDRSFDGITAEIPQEAIWLIKKSNSEEVRGPLPYLQVRQMLERGDISKNDKISKVGTNSYIKIVQQYEFNVDYSIEKVVEGGNEIQKIYIRRRHPRVPYLADIQISKTDKMIMGVCLNISAGGILVEAGKTGLNLGEIVMVKILPSAIGRIITCRALVTGKVPRVPPGYALRFMELKDADKEAIEAFVHESLKKEKVKAIH